MRWRNAGGDVIEMDIDEPSEMAILVRTDQRAGDEIGPTLSVRSAQAVLRFFDYAPMTPPPAPAS